MLEVAPPRCVADLDPLEPLHAPGADVAGDDDAQRRAVDRRERLAVHRPREQDLGAARLVERDRAAEALRRLGLGALVRAVEADVRSVLARRRQGEDVGEPDAGPRRGPGRARPPRRLARDVADRHEPGAAVARALQRRGHRARAERLAQRRERQRQLPLDQPVHPQAPGARVKLRHGAVAAHVERVGRRDRGLVERAEVRLGVEGLLLVDDEARALAVAAHAREPRARRWSAVRRRASACAAAAAAGSARSAGS